MISFIIFGFLFFLGVAVGSFMEVVRVRSSWRASLSGRSRCGACGAVLRYRDLVPIVSFCALRGKCARCGLGISVSHTVAEFLTGLLFVCAFVIPDDPHRTVLLILSTVFLVPIMLTDIERMEIPGHLLTPFTVLSLGVFAVGVLKDGTVSGALNAVALAAPFYGIWLVSRGRAMGLGDAKLALPMGLLLPSFTDSVSVFVFTFWIGALVCLGYVLIRRGGVTGKSRVPLAPMMIAAYMLVLLTGVSFLDPLRFIGGLLPY